MIASPHTYAEWVQILEILKSRTDDENVLSAMKSGTLVWQSGVAERFSQRLIHAVNARMNGAADRFQKEMNRSGGQENAVISALLAFRKEMAFLFQAVDLPAFPDTYRKQYMQMIREEADERQRALEDSAKGDRSGKMSSIVRNHRINVFYT